MEGHRLCRAAVGWPAARLGNVDIAVRSSTARNRPTASAR
jgi:hypothetical protein